MDRWISRFATVLLLAGCSGSGEDEPGDLARVPVTDSAASTGPADSHAMHATPDTIPRTGGSGGMAGMDHSTMGGMDHGTTSAPGSPPSAAAGAHPAGHGGMTDARTPAAGAHPAGHGGMADARAPAAHAADAHPAGHGGMADARAPAAHAAADHSPMNVREGAVGPDASGSAAMRAMDHAQIGRGVDARLLTLVRALVRDSVVQRQIQEDPALREAWADPTVREFILREP